MESTMSLNNKSIVKYQYLEKYFLKQKFLFRFLNRLSFVTFSFVFSDLNELCFNEKIFCFIND